MTVTSISRTIRARLGLPSTASAREVHAALDRLGAPPARTAAARPSATVDRAPMPGEDAIDWALATGRLSPEVHRMVKGTEAVAARAAAPSTEDADYDVAFGPADAAEAEARADARQRAADKAYADAMAAAERDRDREVAAAHQVAAGRPPVDAAAMTDDQAYDALYADLDSRAAAREAARRQAILDGAAVAHGVDAATQASWRQS